MNNLAEKLEELIDSRNLSGVIFDFPEYKQESSSLDSLKNDKRIVNLYCAHGCSICEGQCHCDCSICGHCNCSVCQ